jgi:hypothetical protein
VERIYEQPRVIQPELNSPFLDREVDTILVHLAHPIHVVEGELCERIAVTCYAYPSRTYVKLNLWRKSKFIVGIIAHSIEGNTSGSSTAGGWSPLATTASTTSTTT